MRPIFHYIEVSFLLRDTEQLLSLAIVVFNPFYSPIKSLIFIMKYACKHQDLANIWSQIKQIRVISLKLWVAVARHNFKCVKFQFYLLITHNFEL